MNSFFETEGVYEINGLIFDVKNTCFDYCVREFSCVSSKRINFQELWVNILVYHDLQVRRGVAFSDSTISLHFFSRKFHRFENGVSFKHRLSKLSIREYIKFTQTLFFFPFAVSASCVISSTNAKKTINDFSLFTNRFFLISSVINVSKMTFPILEVTLLLYKLAQHWLP